jgi:hypothetical protein
MSPLPYVARYHRARFIERVGSIAMSTDYIEQLLFVVILAARKPRALPFRGRMADRAFVIE